MDIEALAMLGPETPPAPSSGLPETVDAATLADLFGITSNRVAALARDGVIPRDARRYPTRDAIRAYCEWSRANPAGRRIADAGLAGEKLRLAREQADKIALQNAQARDELVPLDNVRREWLAVAVDLRARLLAIGPRVASALALDRPAAARLDDELRAALGDIADDR